MNAIDERRLFLLQSFGRRDIGEDHELLDEFHGFEPLAIGNGLYLAVLTEDDFAFRQVEVERVARLALDGERLIAGPQCGKGRARRRAHLMVGLSVERLLRARVGQARRGPHRAAQEFVAAFLAVAVEHHAHRKTGPVDALFQRAQIGGEMFRQHRYDAVGKVRGVAALSARHRRWRRARCAHRNSSDRRPVRPTRHRRDRAHRRGRS